MKVWAKQGLEPHENKSCKKRRLCVKGQRYPSLRVGAGALWHGTLWDWDTGMFLFWTQLQKLL